MKKDTKILLILFMVLSLVLLTLAGSYAWFTSTYNSQTANSITTNGVTFHYQEGSRTIGLDDVMPMTDELGKAQQNYFEFEITGRSTNGMILPYYITARKSSNSSNIDDAIKISLSKVQIATSNMYSKVLESRVDEFSSIPYDVEEEDGIWVTYTLLHSAGDTIDHDVYSIRNDASTDSFATIQECEASSEYIEKNNEGRHPTCVYYDDYGYGIEYDFLIFDSLESCQNGNSSDDLIHPQIACSKRYSNGDTYLNNVYEANVWGYDKYNSLEECNQSPYYQGRQCKLRYAAGDDMSEEIEVITTTYDKLSQYTNSGIDLSNHTEKLVYANNIPNSNPYSQKYRLRMWLDEKTDFTMAKYNNASFSLNINVYSNGKVTPDMTIPGLYNDAGDLIASWDTLVNTYGLDVTTDYSMYNDDFDYIGNTYNRTYIYLNQHMYGYIVEHHPELQYGTNIVLGNVSKIGTVAFAGTNIKSIYIPASVEEIGSYAFNYCSNLTNVELAEDSGLTTVGYDIFKYSPWGNSHNSINGITIPKHYS